MLNRYSILLMILGAGLPVGICTAHLLALDGKNWALHVDATGTESLAAVQASGPATWQPVEVDRYWARQKIALPVATQVRGRSRIAWYRCRFSVPADFPVAGNVIHIGGIDDFDVSYLNGRKIGETRAGTPHAWQVPRVYDVPVDSLKPGAENTLLIRVLDVGKQGHGGIYGLPIALCDRATAERAERQCAGFNPHEMRMYSQDIEIAFVSSAAAANAALTKVPLARGKHWAFSARWDDNNGRHQKMRDLMARYGFKGTFYLNSVYRPPRKTGKPNVGGVRRSTPTDYRGKFTRRLIRDGFSIGGHSMNHPSIPHQKKNDMFYEIAAIRVEREADVDRPLNSFVFPGSGFSRRDRSDPHGRRDIVEALRRAGYHHVAQDNFLRVSPGVAGTAFSIVNLVRPGDKDAKCARFDQHVEQALNDPAAAADHPNMTLGVHTWHTAQGWRSLEQSLQKHSGREDWWYCTQTEYAAYRYQYHHSRITKLDVDGDVARWRIERPMAVGLGDDIPLTLRVEGGIVRSLLSAALCPVDEEGSQRLVELIHAEAARCPVRIDAIENWGNAPEPAPALGAAEFPGVCFFLHYDEAANTVVLHQANRGRTVLESVVLTLRLPLLWQDGIQRRALADLGRGSVRQEILPLGRKVEEPAYGELVPYLVAQIDFRCGGKPGRIYATARPPYPVSAGAR